LCFIDNLAFKNNWPVSYLWTFFPVNFNMEKIKAMNLFLENNVEIILNALFVLGIFFTKDCFNGFIALASLTRTQRSLSKNEFVSSVGKYLLLRRKQIDSLLL
jgi:hypothetical protein